MFGGKPQPDHLAKDLISFSNLVKSLERSVGVPYRAVS